MPSSSMIKDYVFMTLKNLALGRPMAEKVSGVYTTKFYKN